MTSPVGGRWRGPGLAALCIVLVHGHSGLALAQTPAPTVTPASEKATSDLAGLIVRRLPPGPGAGGACDAATRSAVKNAAETAVVEAKVTPSAAVAAIEAARNLKPPLDPCRRSALADSAIESAGEGVVVDEADAVRGFALYEGPWPPPPRSALTDASSASDDEQTSVVPQPSAAPAGDARHGRSESAKRRE
jgi:hypothetical protein